MTRVALAVLAAAIALPASAQTLERIYAQELVDRTLATHAELNALTFHVTPPKTADNVIIASNIASMGKKADSDDLSVIETGVPIQEPNKAGDRYGVELPLMDMSGRTIGALAVGFAYKPGDDTSNLLAKAQAITAELAKQIPNVTSLVEPARTTGSK